MQVALALGAVAVLAHPAPAQAVARQPATATQDPGVGSSTGQAPGSNPTATAAPTADNSAQVNSENRRIWLVVGGLVAVALALLLLTIRYWRHTRPLPVDEGGEAQPEPHPDRAREAGDDETRVGRRADPRTRPSGAPTPAPVGAGVGARVGAGGAQAARPRGPAGPTGPGRRSRRAVAGADHSAADDAWEPRGRGEHERIEPAELHRRARLTRQQRLAAYRASNGR